MKKLLSLFAAALAITFLARVIFTRPAPVSEAKDLVSGPVLSDAGSASVPAATTQRTGQGKSSPRVPSVSDSFVSQQTAPPQPAVAQGSSTGRRSLQKRSDMASPSSDFSSAESTEAGTTTPHSDANPGRFASASSPGFGQAEDALGSPQVGSRPADQVRGAQTAIEVSVPIGAKRPAVLLDASSRKTPQIAAAADQITQDFVNQVNGSEGNSQAWATAQETADERYRALFGNEAYNLYTLQAAQEALAEKNSPPAAIP